MQTREVHTRGVVLVRRAAGEGSVRVQLYTEELGLIYAVAKSGREERSKLRPYLLPGTRGVYSLVKGKAEWRVTGAVQAHLTYFECTETVLVESAERVLQLMRTLVHGEGKDEELFVSLWDFLDALPTMSIPDVRIAEYVAVLRMLAALGYVAKSEAINEFMGPAYTAALIVRASERRKDIIGIINEGLGASGLN